MLVDEGNKLCDLTNRWIISCAFEKIYNIFFQGNNTFTITLSPSFYVHWKVCWVVGARLQNFMQHSELWGLILFEGIEQLQVDDEDMAYMYLKK